MDWRQDVFRTDGDELGLWRVLAGVNEFESSCAYRLVVSEAQGGHVLVLQGKLLEVLDDLGQLGKDEIQSTLLEDQVGVVGDCQVSGCATCNGRSQPS